MNKKLLEIQTLLLAAGTVYSWSRVVIQFQTFYAEYGTIFRIKDCTYPNPVTTACFYGAVAFVVALVWSLNLFLAKEPSLKSQRYLRNFLLFAVFFAASVLTFEFLLYYKIYRPAGPIITCSPGVFPLKTPCFVGMIIFTFTYFVAFITVRKNLVSNPPTTEPLKNS